MSTPASRCNVLSILRTNRHRCERAAGSGIKMPASVDFDPGLVQPLALFAQQCKSPSALDGWRAGIMCPVEWLWQTLMYDGWQPNVQT